MKNQDVAWIQYRGKLYRLLAACLMNEPTFDFVLSLMGDDGNEILAHFQQLCPKMSDFGHALKEWKENPKFRKKVMRDYDQIISKAKNGMFGARWLEPLLENNLVDEHEEFIRLYEISGFGEATENPLKQLGISLQFFEKLIRREEQLREGHQQQNTQQLRLIQKTLLEAYFLPRVSFIARELERISLTSFYSALAKVLGEFVTADYIKMLNVRIS